MYDLVKKTQSIRRCYIAVLSGKPQTTLLKKATY